MTTFLFGVALLVCENEAVGQYEQQRYNWEKIQ